MTGEAQVMAVSAMVQPFPEPGPLIRNCYRELDLAANGTDAERTILSQMARPRPWEPATVTDPDMRDELWTWLDDVVTWINHEHTWDPTDLIPGCWPDHPHLIHDLALLADTRRRASAALTSEPLDQWQSYRLPAFADRTRRRLAQHCDHTHQAWPGQPRHREHTADEARHRRQLDFNRDTALTALSADKTAWQPSGRDPRPGPSTIGHGTWI